MESSTFLNFLRSIDLRPNLQLRRGIWHAPCFMDHSTRNALAIFDEFMGNLSQVHAMSSSSLHQAGQRQRRPNAHVASICVVDPQADDYRGWDAAALAGGIRLQIVPSAEAALRIANAEAVDLWVVNIQLPGLSGHELCGLLKSHSTASVYLVADEYSVEAEREAFRQRATLFGTKPAHREWLNQWRQNTSQGAAPRVATGI